MDNENLCQYNDIKDGQLIYRPHIFCECSDGNVYDVGMIQRNEKGEVKIVSVPKERREKLGLGNYW